MAYFLRFTDTAGEDLDRGTSLLDLPSLESPEVLSGLCGYSFADDYELEEMSEAEISAKVKMYQNNVWYDGTPTLFEGEYIEQNPNGEGVIFKASAIHSEY